MNAQEKAKFDELTTKVSELEASVNTEQQQVTDLVAQKDAAIKALQDIIDAGTGTDNTPEIQAVLDKVQAVITDLETTA